MNNKKKDLSFRSLKIIMGRENDEDEAKKEKGEEERR